MEIKEWKIFNVVKISNIMKKSDIFVSFFCFCFFFNLLLLIFVHYDYALLELLDL